MAKKIINQALMICLSNINHMVEVFRTNVKERFHADLLLEQIHKSFPAYKANFDLEDCDKILRIKSESGMVQPIPVILLLNESGFHAEPLSDELPSSALSGLHAIHQ